MAHWQFTYPKRLAFGPEDYEDPGLGGSETALVLLTRELAARGHAVEVFNAPWRPGVHSNVMWRGAWELPTVDTPDVAVAVRFDEANRDSNAPVQLFWMLDDRPDGPSSFANGHPDASIIVASGAQRARLATAGITAPTITIPLPIETGRYQHDQPRQRACLYTAMPNRGLDALLRFWPRIRRQVPDAELWVTSGWQLWGYTHSEAHDRWRQLFGDAALPDGVHLLSRHRTLTKAELIEVQQRAWIGLYPSRFPEMFCYTAAESAVAGTPMVASDKEALPERVDHNHTGILVPGLIDDPATQDQFVTAATQLLTNPEQRAELATAAHQHAAKAYSLTTVADQWERLALRHGAR